MLGALLSISSTLVTAQTDQVSTLNVQSSQAAYEEALSSCNGGTKTYVEETKPGGTHVMSHKFLVTSWTGQCIEGQRHGRGTLQFARQVDNTTNRVELGTITAITKEVLEGEFVNGKRHGLWCLLKIDSTMSTTGQSSFAKSMDKQNDAAIKANLNRSGECTLKYADARSSSVVFRKVPDGRWKPDVEGSAYLPAGELESQSAKLIAAATASKVGIVMRLVLTDPVFEDLLKGGQITLALGSGKPSLKGKRVALILSSSAITEMQRLRRERENLISAGKDLAGSDAEYMRIFAATSDPDRFLAKLVSEIKNYARQVVPVDDLTSIRDGKFDYTLMIDFKFLDRLDLLGKFDSLRTGETLTGLSFKAYLLTSDLNAIRVVNKNVSYTKNQNQKTQFDYLQSLAIHYRNQNTIGDIFSRPILDFDLKLWASD